MKIMKKMYVLFMIFGMMTVSQAQTKSTGSVSVGGGITIKIDLNNASSTATMTLSGPSNVWFTAGLNATSMMANTDCFTVNGSSALDQYLPGNHNAAITDPTNNLTLVSNTVLGSTRTVVVSRPFNTADAKDFTFVYNSIGSLNMIWAVGPSTNLASQHTSFGSATLTFTTLLGTAAFSSLDDVAIFPNPSNGIFSLSKNNSFEISKIRVFDSTAKLIKEIRRGSNDQDDIINLSDLSKGLFFIELSNNENKAVKKVVIN